MMKSLLTLLPVLVLAAACNPASQSSDPSVLAARSEAWDAALNAKDIDALADLYTTDARIMPPNRKIATGQDAVRAEFGAMIDAALSSELTSVETMVSGDIGYNVGNYTLRTGDDVVDTGKYTEIWHRGDDGQWRIANDIWNSDHAAADKGPKTHLMIMHEVDDGEKWKAAWRGKDSRHQLFAENGAKHVHTFQSADNPNLTGLVIAVKDMDALNAMLSSEEGIAAAAADGVRSATMRVLPEVK